MKFRWRVWVRRQDGAQDKPRRRWRDRIRGRGGDPSPAPTRPSTLRGRLLRILGLPFRLIRRLLRPVWHLQLRLRGKPVPARAADDEGWQPAVSPVVRPYVVPEAPALAARNLLKRFGDGPAAVEALRGVNITFEKASFNAIMGPSGSGKSTLMHLLAGLDVPTGGSVEIAGVDLAELGDAELTELRRRQVGFVFQAFNLMATLDAEENIALPLRLAGETPDPAWLESLLRAVDLSDRRDHRPAELSGGQQQRVAIARALVARPSVVFADEPTGNLDSVSSDEVLLLLRRAVDEFGQTVVLVTHDPLAAAYADRIVRLADGRIVDDQPNPDPPSYREVPGRR
ncbi:MAG: putative transport system ATP-binding protein [Solirubrobacteraceae bacterium]|nr:putative transport system ATP-binding protein [Solirubrobacteraceae bacterium]